MNFKVLQTWNFKYCADSVEWCPIAPYRHFFLCGTYELQNSKKEKGPTETTNNQIRLGELLVFSIMKTLQLFLHSKTHSSGILDIKWCGKIVNGKIIFATANADGRICVWNFASEKELMEPVTAITEYRINSNEILSLSIDWSPCNYICVSDSNGYTFVLCMGETDELVLLHKLKVHQYEAWIATFDAWNDSVLYTGGDDSLIKVTDLKTGLKIAQLDEHHSGVTSVRSNHLKQYTFASGSYDESIKIWDTRKMSRSIVTCNIGGGIWRIKWDPHGTDEILTASMYSGFHWLKYSEEDCSLKIKSEFKEHSSIAYGADICFIPPAEIIKIYFTKDNERLDSNNLTKFTATCSFYDKKLCFCIL